MAGTITLSSKMFGEDPFSFELIACDKHERTVQAYMFDISRHEPVYLTREMVEIFDSFGFGFFGKYADEAKLNEAFRIAGTEIQRGFRFFSPPPAPED